MTTSVCNFVMSVSEITQNKVAEWLTVDSEQWFLWKFHTKVTHTILTYCFKFGTKWKLLQVKHVQGLVHAQISSVMKMKSWQKIQNRKFTHSNSSVSCFAPSSVVSNACIVFVALSIFLTQSCPVVSSEAVTTSMYWGKLTVAKTGALEATAPTKKLQNTCTHDRNTSLTC